MEHEEFDFYDSTSLKIYNLDKNMRYQMSILDNLDHLTKKHSENVGNLCCRICQNLRLDKGFIIYATICGYLHDIGKLYIPKEVLFKDGPLTDEEYQLIQTHTTLGYKLCFSDPELRPYCDGPLYHHEALNGSGYPNALTKKDIPFVAQIIRVADEFDALVTKRHYQTHVHISETLKELIKDANPTEFSKTIALEQLSENSQLGKLNPRILKTLCKVVIDDTLYEISYILNYEKYLEENIKRLELIDGYHKKMEQSKKDNKINYYKEGIQLLLQAGETIDNYKKVLNENKEALAFRQKRVKDLYAEIKIIKKLKI